MLSMRLPLSVLVLLALVSESKTQSSNASNETGVPTSASSTSILTSTPPTTSPSPSNPSSPSSSSASTTTSSSPNSSATSPFRDVTSSSPPVSSSEDDPTRPAAIALGTVLSFLCLIVLFANLLMIWLFVKRRQRRRRRKTSSLDGKQPDSHCTFENRYLDNDLDSSSRQQASPIEEPTPNKSRGKRLADKLREVTPNETDSMSSDSDASNESTNSIQPGTVRIEWPQLTSAIHNSPTYKTQISTVSSDSQRPPLVRQRPAQIPGQLGYNDCSV